MTLVELTPGQRQLIDKIAKENGFKDHQVKAITGSAKGDNYLGVITSVTIEDGHNKLELVLKSSHVGEIRNQVPIRKAYQREIFVYEQVFTKFKEIQEEYHISEPFESFAKLYGTCDTESSECLVMEDLRESGYKMWNRKVPMNPEHISAVLKEYAKLHAVSFAMKEKQPEAFEDLTQSMKKHIFDEYFHDAEKTTQFTDTVMGSIFRTFLDDPVTTEALKGFKERLPDVFDEVFKQPAKEVVIDHGDGWCNNLMFQYENQLDTTSPSTVRIIDWQLSKISSPAMDLVHFFLVHSSKEVLHDYENYLKLYHETLSKNLKEFSCDPETVFPYSTLLEHWNKVVKMGIYMAFNMMKIMLCDSEEAPDLTEISDGGKNIMDVMNFTAKDTDTFNTRIKDLVEFSIENGFL
ncbi:unnamed protein product [Phaedon cochleariae]|uniref:CHK kinase-like domain-containing protein n=1 Tax=Phaedon cochleariae TaxID=80249 RepID=A0A9N9X543_PHACE|nr:unnamed protein product [Phaedon cochleariae]